MKRTALRLVSALVIVALLTGYAPALAYAAPSPTESVATGNIEALVSTENGGFIVRTVEGDVIAKDDNNKDLLYRRDRFDTSFTSFRVTEGAGEDEVTRDYIFGNDYSYLGLGGGSPTVTNDGGRITAVWSVDGLTFTQTLEPVVDISSSEHGTVRIWYSVSSQKDNPVSVKARLLLDTALGDQDYAYYELAKGPASAEFDRVENERVLDEAGDYIPPNFFAYDDYENPSVAAYTVEDFSDSALRPYRMAFGHWNNLASTVFDFTPDGDLTFTNPYNKSYLTADSAFALYYDLGEIRKGGSSVDASIYYGVDSHVDLKESDRVGITTTCSGNLTISEDGNYVDPAAGASEDAGFITVQTNITNLARDNAKKIDKLRVAVLVDDGFTPQHLDGSAIDMDPGTPGVDPPTNKAPYTVELSNLEPGEVQPLTWRIKADVGQDTAYRRIIFRAYDMSGSPDGLLLMDNLAGSAAASVLCPGRGGLPSITFTSAGPSALYNQGKRHIFLTGTGFSILNGSYQPFLYLKSDRSKFYPVPSSNIIFDEEEKPGVLEIVVTEEMPAGDYELSFRRNPGTGGGLAETVTAPSLSFLMTADPAYRNDTYGVVAVVKTGSAPNFTYSIKVFEDESSFKEFSGDALLVFRGGFSITEEADGKVLACSAVSTSQKDTVNINGALDFEDGNVQIYRGGSGNDRLLVEFNGDLYTTNSRTSVWSGESSLTPLVDGADYGLIKYNERGERVFGEQPQNIISLVWPWGYNMLQTIGGMAVDFRYGQFGAMYDDDDTDCSDSTGYVVSFGGKLDLSFLMPGGSKQAEEAEREKDEKRSGTETSSAGGDGLKKDVSNYSPSEEAKEENEKNKVEPAGKVNIEDILFGNNEGYLGFNSSAEIMLPKYVHALPAMGGKLDINTIGGYKVGVLGKVKTVKMEMEFELKVKSSPEDGHPIPDKLYFFMGGWEPGVNIDAAGGIWITGIGGGIDKLYDTIFRSGGTIPLTLLLSASFDILKVMSGRADLALSLRGFQMKMSNVKLKNTDKVVIDSGIVSTQWSPDFYLQLSAWLNILQTIEGKTYLVVDDGFIEFFARADVNIPKDVKVVGGMTVANVDLGGNADKLWGTLKALGVKLGVTYYWGGDVGFGTGANTANPTYPELLGVEDVPVGVAGESGETLYLRVGSNLSSGVAAQVVEDLDSALPVLLGVEPSVKSNIDRTVHVLNLGDSQDDAAITITFRGDGRPATAADVLTAVTVEKPDGSSYPLTLWTKGVDPMAANANAVVDDEARTSTLSFTITDYLAGDWAITTSQAADIVLYEVGALPEATSFTASMNEGTGKLDLSWAGSGLDGTEITIYATPNAGGAGDPGEIGFPVWAAGGVDGTGAPRPAPEAAGQAVSVNLPEGLSSGDYYVRMVVSKEDAVNQSVMATGAGGGSYQFTYVNSAAPAAPGPASLANCGDDMLRLTVEGPGAFDGYLVSLYEDTGAGLVETDFMDVPFEKDGEGQLPDMKIGGTYETYEGDGTEGAEYGLVAGKSYVAKVSAYNIDDGGTPDNQTDDLLIRSAGVETPPVVLSAASSPAIAWEGEAGAFKAVPKKVTGEDGKELTVQVDTFTTGDVDFALKSSVPVTGYWSIDGSLSRDPLDPDASGMHPVNNVTSVSVNQELCDGEHTVYFAGTDAEGDTFSFTKVFAVDTTPPRLMLESPVDGTFFTLFSDPPATRYYRVPVTGLGDSDALYTFMVDGETVVSRKTLSDIGVTLDPFGVFNYYLNVGEDDVSSHVVTVIAEDAAGNTVSSTVSVRNEALAEALTGVGLLRDGNSCEDIELSSTEPTAGTMQLQVIPEHAAPFVVNEDTSVLWTAVTRQGSAQIDPDGAFSIEPGSAGYIEGEWKVSDAGAMKQLATFGTEIVADGRKDLTLNASPGSGGTATGGGPYYPSAIVTLTATPLPGYEFVGWESSDGGSFADALSATTIYTMPATATTVTANFEAVVAVVDIAAIPGVTAPARGAAPVSGIVETEQYDGAITWNPDHSPFRGDTIYTAIITLTPKEGYTLGGVPEDFFTVAGATSVANAADSGVITVTFPATKPVSTYHDIEGQAFASAGSHVAIPLPEDVASGSRAVIPYYTSGGREVMVPFSDIVDGKLVFLAPATATFYTRAAEVEFADTEEHWAQESIDFTVARGLFNGTGDGLFEPEGQMTRAMFATVIARLDGADLSSFGGSRFADVASGEWYAAPVEWAASAGIVNGTGTGAFSPDGPVTREEMAAMLVRYLTYKGFSLNAVDDDPESFADGDSVSGWASEAMEAMRRSGIITGKPGSLADPQGNATRAECSAVFQRLIHAVLAALQ